MKLTSALLLLAGCLCFAIPARAISPDDLKALLKKPSTANADKSGPDKPPDDDPVVTRVFPLRYSEARSLNITQSTSGTPIPFRVPGVVETLQSLLYQKPVDGTKDPSRAPSIPDVFAHRTQNAVVILDKKSHMAFYERTIRDLDRERPLIEISVAIIDINSDAALAFGTEILAGATGTVSEGTGALRASSFPQGTDLNPIVDGLNTAAGTLPSSPLSPALVEGQPFSVAGMIANSTSRLVTRIRTLETAGKAHLMTRPSILTLANSEATFSDDTHLFIPVPGVNFANIYEVPVITQIKVIPRQVKKVEDGPSQIQLVVVIDDSAITTSVDPNLANTPMVQSGSVSSQAVVSEKGSLLVAGRYRHDQTLSDARAPILGRIPVLGLLFKQKSVIKNRVQRFYLISPRVVSSQQVKTDHFGSSIWNYDQEARAATQAMEDNPLLPPLEQLSPAQLREEERRRKEAKGKEKIPSTKPAAVTQPVPATKPVATLKPAPAAQPPPQKVAPMFELPAGEGNGPEPEPKHGKVYLFFHRQSSQKTSGPLPPSAPDR